jgi:putative methyltransferase
MNSREGGAMAVLVSEPQAGEIGLPYLPVMWGILKTYWEHHGDTGAVGVVDWMAPIWQMRHPDELLEPYAVDAIEVLGLSCYTWNWSLQCMIAERVKAANPGCVVVAGGPDPDYKDPEFFIKHPYVDVVVVKDGEIPFTRILERVLRRPGPLEDPDAFCDVPGLYLPGLGGGGHRYTSDPEVPRAFDRSPYLEQSDHYGRLIADLPMPPAVIWETNRGCPYKCSYCDWGSNTMSKLRRFDMRRIESEIEWFGKHGIGFVMLADANFGMLARDLDIVDLAIAAHDRYGFPAFLSYNTAKNHPDRTVAIARKLIASGLASSHILSIQHTDPDVLAATERSNISTDKQRQVVRELIADGVPIYVQLIQGIPGDSPAVWKRCFTDLMEWGIHNHWWVFPYMLLPNAPAAEPEFVERWQIRTLDRYVVTGPGWRERAPWDPITDTPGRIVVDSASFSREDWKRMSVHTAWVKALHNCALTQSLACYLRFTHDVTYDRFYDEVIEEFVFSHELTARMDAAVREHYDWYLADEDALDFMDIPQLDGFDFQLEPSRWLYVQICMQIDAFYDALASFLERRHPHVANLRSAVDYQRNIMVVPRGDRAAGHTFATDLDWVGYFDDLQGRVAYEPLAEPRGSRGATISAREEAPSPAELLPDANDERELWIRWLSSTVLGGNAVLRYNFQHVELREPEQRAPAHSR